MVRIELPSLLHHAADGEGSPCVEARTLRGALDALVGRHPRLRVHLFDERGAFRQHVLCFHNRTNTRWLESLDVPVAEGDTITFLQAVSGG